MLVTVACCVCLVLVTASLSVLITFILCTHVCNNMPIRHLHGVTQCSALCDVLPWQPHFKRLTETSQERYSYDYVKPFFNWMKMVQSCTERKGGSIVRDYKKYSKSVHLIGLGQTSFSFSARSI